MFNSWSNLKIMWLEDRQVQGVCIYHHHITKSPPTHTVKRITPMNTNLPLALAVAVRQAPLVLEYMYSPQTVVTWVHGILQLPINQPHLWNFNS